MTATTGLERQPSGEPHRSAWLLIVTGRVQGVGFRPAVTRLARSLLLFGVVRNTREGATIIIEGDLPALAMFVERLPNNMPVQASIENLTWREVPLTGRTAFTMETGTEPLSEMSLGNSAAGAVRGTSGLRATVPVDLRVCDECLAECRSGNDRRAGDVMISCTQCGPRYSILRAMPYERSDTSMARFKPCPACRLDYESAENRRFHAQTVSCPNCGPRVDSVAEAIAVLRWGGVVALKGLGGYQFLVDATSPAAVARLRSIKQRPSKPLAVLVGSIEAARRYATLGPLDEQLLRSAAGPIVVAPRRSDTELAPEVAGALGTVGLMLPTTALHATLADAIGPLVATSGNLEGDPLVYDDVEANDDLAGMSDAVLRHDRAIERPVDDSVVRGIAGSMVTLRLARGFAPAQLPLGDSSLAAVRDSIVALGGHQKAACALWNGEQAALGPFVGDLDSLATRRRYVEQLAALRGLYGIAESATIACDAHPDYFTTRLAAELARDGQRVIHVQHHHAHIAAAMLEHRLLDRRVLGVAWDGTGWGPDGTIWGGEFLESSAGEFQRRARLRPLLLPGGETAIRQPWRTAAWLLRASRSDGEALVRRWLGESRWRQFAPLGERPWPGIWTSSIGRLFDAVALLVLPEATLPQGVVEYEGQAAMLLEDLAEQARDNANLDAYPLPLIEAQVPELDWRPLIAAVAEDRLRGIAAPVMARRFHEALAGAIGAVGARFPALPIVLGGGVFQNRWLVERVVEWGERAGRLVVFPAKIPPNDGGLAAGQLVVSLAQCASQQACV